MGRGIRRREILRPTVSKRTVFDTALKRWWITSSRSVFGTWASDYSILGSWSAQKGAEDRHPGPKHTRFLGIPTIGLGALA